VSDQLASIVVIHFGWRPNPLYLLPALQQTNRTVPVRVNKDAFVAPSRALVQGTRGSTGNIVVGAFPSFAPWALGLLSSEWGAKWISGEVDKQLLKENVKVAATS
jgi:hypothetical protein